MPLIVALDKKENERWLKKIDIGKIAYPITMEYSKDRKNWKFENVKSAAQMKRLIKNYFARVPAIK